jgi:hypothetical protein
MIWKGAFYLLGFTLVEPFTAHAVTNSRINPFQPIVTRNAFRLQPPQKAPETKLPPILSRIKLLGITTILGDKRAILRVQRPAIPGEILADQSLILIEGQSEGSVTVTKIDETAGTVEVNHAGTTMLLRL